MVFWSSDSFQRELHLSELDVNIETLKLETPWHRLIMNWLSCLAWHSFALSVLNIQMKAYLSWTDLIIFHLFISPSKNGWESYHGLDLCFLPQPDRYLEAWAHQNIQSVLQPIFGLDKICTADLIVGNLYDNVNNEQPWRPPLTFQWRSRWFSMLKTFSRQNVVKYEFYVCWMFFIIIRFCPMCSWFGVTILTMLMCYIYNLKYIYIAGIFLLEYKLYINEITVQLLSQPGPFLLKFLRILEMNTSLGTCCDRVAALMSWSSDYRGDYAAGVICLRVLLVSWANSHTSGASLWLNILTREETQDNNGRCYS